MIAPLFAVALQLQRLGTSPISSATDLSRAHVRIDADHVALGTLLQRLGDALGVAVAIRRGEADEIQESVIADDAEVGPLLGMLAKGEPVALDVGSGAPVLTAEYFPPVAIAAEPDPGGERCRLADVDDASALQRVSGWLRPAQAARPVTDRRFALDLEACPIQGLASRLHELFGVRVVVSPEIAGVRITAHAADTAAALFFENLRRVARVRIDSSAAGIATLAFTVQPPHRYPYYGYYPAAVPRETTIATPDDATAAALEPVLARYLSRFGTVERRGRELHVIDDADNLDRLRRLTDAYVHEGWRPPTDGH